MYAGGNSDCAPESSFRLEHGGLSFIYDAKLKAYTHFPNYFKGNSNYSFWGYFPSDSLLLSALQGLYTQQKSGIIRTFRLNDVVVALQIRCIWCLWRQHVELDFGVYSPPSTQGRFVGDPRPFEAFQKTLCCGRVTTEFFHHKNMRYLSDMMSERDLESLQRKFSQIGIRNSRNISGHQRLPIR